MTYRVYHLTRLIHQAASRDAALAFITMHSDLWQEDRANYEILDQSDEVAS
jgi:hypothetical protein